MKKMNVLLDDTLIINLPFFWKLVKRYYGLSIGTIFLVAILSIYFYSIQNVVYMTQIGFNYVPNETNSPTQAIASMLGEKSQVMTPGDITDIGKSIDFRKKLSSKLVEHPDFNKINLNGIRAINKLTNKEMFKGCDNNKKCISEIVADKVGFFYFIDEYRASNTRFFLKVQSLDTLTTKTLTDVLKEMYGVTRKNTIKKYLTEQITISEKLITQKRNELKDVDVINLTNQKLSIMEKIRDVDIQLRDIQRIYNNKRMELSEIELTIKLSNSDAFDKRLSLKERISFKKYHILKSNIEQLKNDISTLSAALGDTTNQDRDIIDQLQKEMNKNVLELEGIKYIDKFKSIELGDKNLGLRKRTDKFSYRVKKKQFENIRTEFKELAIKKEKLVKKKIEHEQQFTRLEPIFEYLKLLETKKIQLKLVESTIVSDLAFDENSAPITVFKRTSMSKIIFFAAGLALFLLILMIVIRYLFDSRIFDEYELRKNFEDLDVIGNIPEFR